MILSVLLPVMFLLTVVFLYLMVVVVCAVVVKETPLQQYTDRYLIVPDLDKGGILNDYTFVGTHGSSAYRIDPSIIVDDRGVKAKSMMSWMDGLVRRWSLNQHYDIYSQLCMGVRFLHLEVGLHEQEWVTLHSYYCGQLVDDVTQIVNFIQEEGNKAFVFIKMDLFGASPTDLDKEGKTAMIFLEDLCGIYLWPRSQPIQKTTKLQALQQKIIILQDCVLYPQDYTADETIFYQNRQIAEIDAFMAEREPDERLQCFQWVMTPATAEIVRSCLLPFPITSLATLPAVIRPEPFAQALEAARLPFQIFLVDHITPEIVQNVDSFSNSRLI